MLFFRYGAISIWSIISVIIFCILLFIIIIIAI